MRRLFSILYGTFLFLNLPAQTYAPPAGQPGSTAIHKDSSIIIGWCTQAHFQAGPMDISNPGAGSPTVGSINSVTGPADISDVLSLGDGGTVTCQFTQPIANGPGFDFAVFENSIDDSFLELAFVEVSSDGLNFFRFPAHSLTDTVSQTWSFGTTDASRINNLAGKYRGGFGTPFDLQELSNIPGLNIGSITHVRVIDVVGCIQPAYASRDSKGNKINDPWPTAFPSSGFDLDAIAVLDHLPAGVQDLADRRIACIPNPVKVNKAITMDFDYHAVECVGLNGQQSYNFVKGQEIIISSPGVYLLIFEFDSGVRASRKIIVTD